MGIPGVPLNISDKDIVKAIKKNNGIISHVCKDLGISTTYFYANYYNDPTIKQIIDDERAAYVETLCDMAENALYRALDQKSDHNASIKASQFILNNQGRKRGYKPPALQNEGNSLNGNEAIYAIKIINGE